MRAARHHRWRLTAAALAALTSGCTVGPNFATPAAPAVTAYVPNAAEELAPGTVVASCWWQEFKHPDLDRLIDRVHDQSQTLAAARAALARARELDAAAHGGSYPEIDAAANAARLRTSLLSEGINQLGPTTNDFAIGPTVSYALDLAGGRSRLLERQDALLEFEGFQFDGAVLALTGNAVRLAIAEAAIHARIDTAETLVRTDEQTLELVTRLYDARFKTRLDVTAARAQLAQDRLALPALQRELASTHDALSVIAGAAPADADLAPFRLADFVVRASPPMVVPSELVRRRPDIRSAEARLHAASAAIGVATARLYPSVTLSASLTQESLTTATLFTQSAMGWMVASGISAPIFDGGRLRAERRAAIDDYETAYADYRQTVLASFGQVADLLQSLRQDEVSVTESRQAVDAAAASLEAARGQYAAGRTTILRILDAQRELGRAKTKRIDADAATLSDTALLFTAFGAGAAGQGPTSARCGS